MISDAYVCVTCDNDVCSDSVEVGLSYVYMNQFGGGGHYDSDDKAIVKKLTSDHDWVVDDDKHFCCEECRDEVKDD